MKRQILIILLGLLSIFYTISAQSIEPYNIWDIQMSGDGSRFAIVGRQITVDGDVNYPIDIYDSTTYQLVLSFPLDGLPTYFGLNKNGTKLGYILPMQEFAIFDLQTMTFVSRDIGATQADYQGFSWSPINEDVYAYGLGISLNVGDSGGPIGGQYSTNYIVVGTGWTINGNVVASQYFFDLEVTDLDLWDINSNSQNPIVETGNGYGGTSNISLSLETGWIATKNLTNVSIFDSNLNWIKDIPAPIVYRFAWSPDGTELAIATGTSLDVWDITSETISYSYNTNAQNVIWLPNGDLIHDGTEIGFYQNGTPVTEFVVDNNLSCNTTVSASNNTELIAAINTGNSAGVPYTICLENSTYTLNAVDNSNGLGANGLPVITGDIRIVGNGATITRDASAPLFRFFRVADGANLTLDGVTLSNGETSGDGGAIYNAGTLTVKNSTLTGNTASYEGGAIYNDSGDSLTLENSNFDGNLPDDINSPE